MPDIRDITGMCKAGQVQEAYKLAKEGYASDTNSQWAQRALGWALYYTMKNDAEHNDYAKMVEHLDELKSLDQLTGAGDSMIFDNVQFQIAMFVKAHIPVTAPDASSRLSALFHRLKDYQLNPSRGHSFLLQSFIKFEGWEEMADFIDWWNLDKLLPDDYKPFKTQSGQEIMALAERAFIAYSKALLKHDDTERIKEFLPKLDNLMTGYPKMMYPGYFYGKLLLKLGSDEEEALKVTIPFARKKAADFWVWQLLSDVFAHDPEKQLACLLRAVHCRTQENFLGKVRIKLATLYIQAGQLDRAKFHIDAITRCYVSQGWKLPYEVSNWIHQPWINTVAPNGSDPIDYKQITDRILCDGAEEAVAVVTYIDPKSHRATVVYGQEQREFCKLPVKAAVGSVLRIHYVNDATGQFKVLNAIKIAVPDGLPYIKETEGTVNKKENNAYAFLKSTGVDCFISPDIVRKYSLSDKEHVKALVVYDYNKKKESWTWICITIKK